MKRRLPRQPLTAAAQDARHLRLIKPQMNQTGPQLTRPDHTVGMTSNIIVCLCVFPSMRTFRTASVLRFVVTQGCEAWNALAQWSLSKVGGFPLGAANPAARKTLYGSIGWLSCGFGLHSPDRQPWLYCICRCFATMPPPHPSLLEKRKKETRCENTTPCSLPTLSW